MTNKAFAWSHSALNSFETCARRHYLTRVAKQVHEPPSEALSFGRAVHTALQKRLDDNTPLPEHLKQLEPVCQLLLRKRGIRLVEEKWAIDKNFNPLRKADGKCDYFNPTVWCRTVVDVGMIGTRSAVNIDWKTGKRKVDHDQLALSAAICFAHYPYVEEVHTIFVWLNEKKVFPDDVKLFTREQVSDIWSEFLPRVRRLELAHQQNIWHPKPSGLCGKWCPVTRQHCEHGK